MVGYKPLELDAKGKKILGVGFLIGIVLFSIGIVIGFFTGKSRVVTDGNTGSTAAQMKSSSCSNACNTDGYSDLWKAFAQRHLEQCSTSSCIPDSQMCSTYGLPKTYIAYHLNGKTINIDGKLNDAAWQEVPWTDSFIDIRGSLYPIPPYDTKVKIRWDDNRLYVGAYLEEKDLWATFTQTDSLVYKENALEVILDIDGSMFNFKQVQINALGTTLDLMYYKSPYDLGGATLNWTAQIQKAVFRNGTINDPSDRDSFWSVELAFTFEALAHNTSRTSPQPRDNEAWFMEFARSERPLKVKNNQYYKVNTTTQDSQWWSWQPCGAINLLLQDRWGLVQFKKDKSDTSFNFEKWHIYKTLFDVFDAMNGYFGRNKRYTDNLQDLTVPPYIFSQKCVNVPTVQLTTSPGQSVPDNYIVTVKSKQSKFPNAHIRKDRKVWFDSYSP